MKPVYWCSGKEKSAQIRGKEKIFFVLLFPVAACYFAFPKVEMVNRVERNPQRLKARLGLNKSKKSRFPGKAVELKL